MVTPVAQQNKLSKMLVTSLVQNNTTIYASILIYNVLNYKMYYHKLI